MKIPSLFSGSGNSGSGNDKARDRKILRRIAVMTGPTFVELFLTSLFNVVDMIMVGRLSPAAIAGVGLTQQPLMLMVGVFQSVNVGTTTLISWSIGERNYKRAGYILRQTITLNLILGAVLIALGYFIAPYLMGLMSDDPVTISYSIQYMQILCLSLVFMGVTMGITAGLRGSGNSRIPMIYNIVANVLNVLMNYTLIYGKFGFPRLEVAGAAIATTVSRGISFALALLVVLVWKRSPIKVNFEGGFKPDLGIFKSFLTIGLPAAGEQFVIQSGLMIFSRLVSSLGVITFAAHQIVSGINSMAFAVSQSFSVANTALVGHAIGGGDYDLAERTTRLSRRTARITSVVIAVGLILCSRPLASLYTDVEEVIAMATPMFIFIAMIQFSQSSQMCFAGALRGAGDSLYPLYATIAGIWGFRVALAFLFIVVFKLGLTGAWGAFFLDQTARNFVVMSRFNTGKWKEISKKRRGLVEG